MSDVIGTPMNWKEAYEQKLTTAAEAVKLIKSHDRRGRSFESI